MKIIFLSDKGRRLILSAVVLTAFVLLLFPFGIVSCLQGLYGAELKRIYELYAIVVFAAACVPLAVLYFSRHIVRLSGKYGLCLILACSLAFLLLFNNSGTESLLKYQWWIAVPLMMGSTAYGFFSPHKIMLPRLYTPVFFMFVGIFGILELVNILCGWLPSGVILNVLLVLFFACLQAGQANILRHRLQREKASDVELKVLVLNYGLIFAINFCGLLLSAHAMKICLAFMFDNIAAENGVRQNRGFS